MSTQKYATELAKFKGTNVVVTGGAGFIGSHIAERLRTLGARVSIIDNFTNGNKLVHKKSSEGFTIHKADVTNLKSMSDIFHNADYVFHLAAVVGVEETQSNPLEVLRVEIGGTINVFSLANKNKVKRLIFASSSEVYGDSEKPMSEDSALCPKSTYAVTKIVGEEYCKAFYKRDNLDYTILRYFNVYGPRQDKRFVISRFVDDICRNQPITIYGDGNQTRDFTYIDDAINMTLLAALSENTRCEAINVGTGIPVSIKELADLTTSLVNSKDPVKPVYADYGGNRPVEVEVFSRMADMTRTKKLLKYKPETTLKTGLHQYIDWHIEGTGKK